MKKGKDCFVGKYVYHSFDGVFYRIDLINGHSVPTQLSFDFPAVDVVATSYPQFKVVLNNGVQEITAWTDKHKNVVVRFIDKSIVQTKINF